MRRPAGVRGMVQQMRKGLRNQLVLLLVVLLLLPALATIPAAGTGNEKVEDPGTAGRSTSSSTGQGAGRGRAITPTMPDIILSALNWSLSAPDDGAQLTVFATLFNDGTDIAGTFSADILVDGTSVASPIVSGLLGGSTATVHAGWTVQPGYHEIAAVADKANGVLEANETNNLRQGFIDIPYPDLQIQNVSWYPRDYRNGERVTFTVTVHNGGAGGTTRPVFLESHMDQLRLDSQIIGGLGHGNTAQASLQWTATPGNHTLFLTLDPGKAVREVTEVNNRMMVRMGQDYPDLVITNITVPANLTDGAVATFGAAVANLGPAPTTASFDVGFLVDGNTVGVVNVVGLSVNSTRNVSAEWTVRPGSHTLRVEADLEGRLGEAVETNNFRLQEIIVGYPNLVVREVTWEQSMPTDGREVRFNITVKNTGPGPTARPVQLRLLVDGQDGGITTAAALAAGEQANLSANWTALPGSHEVYAEVDPGAVIDEADETDNWLLREIAVPYPDIRLANLTVFPASAESGQTVRLSTAVSNAGPGNTSRTFAVSFFAGGRELWKEPVSGLGRGEVLDLGVDWTAQPGVTDLAAVADELDEITELDELNNQVTWRLAVAFPDLAADISSWSPANAGAGQPLNVTASVRNGGANTSLPFRLGLYDSGMLVGSVQVAGMRAGEVIVQNFSFVLGSDSPTISLVADYDDAVLEMSELDNGFAFSYPGGAILPKPPALDLAFNEVRLFPEAPVDGEPVTLLAAINLTTPGEHPPQVIDISCIVDGVTALDQKVRLSGSEGVARFELKPLPGPHTIIVTIDSGHHIAQSRLDNDQAFDTLLIMASDPVVAGFFPPVANAVDGEFVSVTCSLQNNGPGATRNGLSVRLLVDGRPRSSQTLAGLVPGSNGTLIFTFEAFPGTHRLKVELVRDSHLRQTNVTNDQAVSLLSVERPQLAISSITAPGSADEGAPVSFSATVTNRGATTTRDTIVRFCVDGLVLGDSPVGGLFAGRSTTVTREWKALPGSHRLTAVADARRSAGESDETDNSLTVSAINVSRPDLRVENLRLVQQPLDGAEGLVSADIVNTGNVTTRAVSVQFLVDETSRGQVSLGAVPAGERFTVSKLLGIEAGHHLLRAVAVPAGGTSEANETDNDAWLEVNGTGFAELSPVGLKVPPTAVDGEMVLLFAELENTGNSTVRPFAVSFIVDGLRIWNDQVDGLPAGGMASCSAIWTATPGKHRVRAVVDPEDSIIELDETNNWMQKDGLATEPPDILVEEATVVPAPALTAPDQYCLFVTLANIGGPTLRDVIATVYLDGRPVGNVDTNGMPARNSTQLSLMATARGATTLSVTADKEGGLAEGDESNNAASFPFAPVAEIEGTKPDLTVRGVWMVPEEPIDGQPARIYAAVGNDGNATLLRRTETRLSYGGRNSTTGFNGLVPGGTVVTVFDIIAVAGAMELNVTVDPGNAVAEERNDNNWRAASFSALVPDLRVVGLLRSNATEGLESPMFAVVENNGTGDTVGKITIDIYIAGRHYVQKSLRGLLSGERHCLAFDWRAQPGETDIVLWVGRAQTTPDPTDIDNRLHERVYTGYPDLSVANITWPQFWQNEEGTSLFVEVQNEGAATGRPTSVTLAADAEVLGTIRLDGMAANSRTVLSWKWAPQPGNHTFSAAVDVNNELAEDSENNNRLAKELPSGMVSPPPASVNLMLSNLSYQQSRQRTTSGNNTTKTDNLYRLNFTITNNGGTNTSFCNALLIVDGLMVAELDVHRLLFNTSANLSFDWLAPYSGYIYKVVLDDRRQIAEDIETDNDDTIAIISNRPPVVSTAGPYKAKTGDPVAIKGLASDTDGYIALYEWDLDGDGVFGGRNDTVSTTTGIVTKIFRTAGQYRVSLRVTDDQGATATETRTVEITDKPAQRWLSVNDIAIIGITIILLVCVTTVIVIFKGEGGVLRRKKP